MFNIVIQVSKLVLMLFFIVFPERYVSQIIDWDGLNSNDKYPFNCINFRVAILFWKCKFMQFMGYYWYIIYMNRENTNLI